MLVRNIHLGIVNRVYDGIASSSWENGMDVKFVFTMPTGNLECIRLWKTGRRYLDWMPNSGSVSRSQSKNSYGESCDILSHVLAVEAQDVV